MQSVQRVFAKRETTAVFLRRYTERICNGQSIGCRCVYFADAKGPARRSIIKRFSSAVVGPFRAVVADGPRAHARARLVSIYGNGTRIPRHGAPTAAALIYINFRRVYMRINAPGPRSRQTRILFLSLSLSRAALFQHSSAKRTGRAFELSTPKFERRMLDETAHENKPRHSIAESESRPRELFSRKIQIRSENN